MSKRKGIHIPPPHLTQLDLFGTPPTLKPVLENKVIFNGRAYLKQGEAFIEYINGKPYEAYGEALLTSLQAIWLDQNTMDGKLFIEGETNHQL